MGDIKKFVVFGVGDQLFALSLSTVKRIIRIVEITSLPKAPDYVKGIINFHGEILPVIDIRMLFNLPEKEIELSDQLIIAETSVRTIALWVDSISEVIERADEEIIKSEKIMYGADFVKGVLKLDDGIVLIHDLDQFLTIEEINLLKVALNKEKEKEDRLKFLEKEKANEKKRKVNDVKAKVKTKKKVKPKKKKAK